MLRVSRTLAERVEGFEADELSPHAPIDDDLKRDLLGARQRLLFVEGTESSLDKPLYDLLFPMVSVIPKGNCRDVEQAVVAARAAEEFHWLRAFGIVDGDGFGAPQIAAKRERGVYATPYYSVEAIYFHPQIIEKIAVRQASVSGGDSSQLAKDAIASGVSAIRGHTGRLSEKAVKKGAYIQKCPNFGSGVRIFDDADRCDGGFRDLFWRSVDADRSL